MDTEDSKGLHWDDEEEVAKIMKDLGKKNKKNLGKGLKGRNIEPEVNSVEDYKEEDEGMETYDEDDVKEVGTSKVQVSKMDDSLTKRRRGGDT